MLTLAPVVFFATVDVDAVLSSAADAVALVQHALDLLSVHVSGLFKCECVVVAAAVSPLTLPLNEMGADLLSPGWGYFCLESCFGFFDLGYCRRLAGLARSIFILALALFVSAVAFAYLCQAMAGFTEAFEDSVVATHHVRDRVGVGLPRPLDVSIFRFLPTCDFLAEVERGGQSPARDELGGGNSDWFDPKVER